MFTTHPIEKPFFIYQIGSSDPELAVQAAKVVMQDVSGFDLNCGCPKPFSTHSGMGAALLTNPDLLCSILSALRREMPPEITISAKIRLLPSQEDTLKLVERIVNTGISALTVHCRTRSMRDKDKALIDRLKEIVDFVEGMGKGVAVIENGDCDSLQDALRIREVTGKSSHWCFFRQLSRYLSSTSRCTFGHDCEGCRIKSLMFLVDSSHRLGGNLHSCIPPSRTYYFHAITIPVIIFTTGQISR